MSVKSETIIKDDGTIFERHIIKGGFNSYNEQVENIARRYKLIVETNGKDIAIEGRCDKMATFAQEIHRKLT